MHLFDYSLLLQAKIPSSLLTAATALSELKTLVQIREASYPQLAQKLEQIARVQSVKSSNAIEGIVTSDERIRAIVQQNSAPLDHNESEISGYRDALNLVHTRYADLDFRVADIRHLHQTMLAYTPARGGDFKQNDNLILEINAQGLRQVRFTPTSAHDTPLAMEQLVLAFLDARTNANLHPLLLIPCTILDFLCIHPFTDGNGRLSRLLSLLLLRKAGFSALQYVSFEEQINQTKGAYYEALRQSSLQWHTTQNDPIPFVEYFISTLISCYKELEKRFAVVRMQKVSKKQRIEEAVLQSLLPISKKELCDILPDVSPSTVEAVLAHLLKTHQIAKIGTSNGAKYIRA